MVAGYQTRNVTCVGRRNNAPVDESLCDPTQEPEDTQSCNENNCPAEWVEEDWSPCTKHCGEGGVQTRNIKCEQVISAGRIAVEESQCVASHGPKGATKRECNKDKDCPQYHLGPWKPVRRIKKFSIYNFERVPNFATQRNQCFLLPN